MRAKKVKSKITKEQYIKAEQDHNKWGGYLEDAIEAGNKSDIEKYKKLQSDAEDIIHRYERSYEHGGEIQSKIDKLQKVVDSDLPQFARDKAKSEIERLKAEQYVEAKKESLKSRIKDKSSSKEQKERDEKELALFESSEKPKPTPKAKPLPKPTAKKEIVGYGIVDNISGEIVASKKTLPELMEASKKLEKRKGFEDMGSLVYEIVKVDGKNVVGDKVTSVDVNTMDLEKGRLKPEPKPKFKVGDMVSMFSDEPSLEVVEVYEWSDKKATYDLKSKDGKIERGNISELKLIEYVKPKPDHKKLVEKLKAKKSKAEPSNEPSVGHKRDEKRDRKLVAKPLGKRISESGNVYYENRLNRADKSPKRKFEEGGEIKPTDQGKSGWGLDFLNW